MHFDDEAFEKLTRLARIKCSEEERKQLTGDLDKIVSYIDQLKSLDTEGVTPTNHVLELHNAFRDDKVEEARVLSREEFLNNSPDHVAGMVRVPPVLRKSNS